MKNPNFSGTLQEKSFKVACDKVVNDYFDPPDKSYPKIARTGNKTLRVKAVLVSAVYILSYISIITVIKNPWLALGMVVIFSLAQVAVGMCIMHDASHNAFSEKKSVNASLSKYGNRSFGMYENNWFIQHIILHHINTNLKASDQVLGDEDIEAYGLLRLSEHGAWKPMHRYQHIYAWPLYMIVTFGRFFGEPFRLAKYIKKGLTQRLKINPTIEYIKIIIIKLTFIFFIWGLPLLATDFSWLQVGVGYLVMNFVSSFSFTLIFQLAHIVMQAKQPPIIDGVVQNDWFIHEMYTSCDFVVNPIFGTLIGGLNRQKIHHGWRKISHVHFEKIAKLLKPVFKEFNVPYNENPSFFKAVVSHYQRLKQLSVYKKAA